MQIESKWIFSQSREPCAYNHYYAALNLGAIVVNLNPMYTVDELKALTSDTGVSTLFTFDMVLPNIRPLCREVDIARIVVTRVTDLQCSLWGSAFTKR
jgi:acyl-coenzyme A synthetase/AMP-(fatty) acid ligase